MDVECVTSVAVITAEPKTSRELYLDALGLPLRQLDGEYYATEELSGCRHFGVWPLAQAAEACFGSAAWPPTVPLPQMSIEFELASRSALDDGAAELRARGYELLHGPKTEPWGQTLARLISPEGAIVGLSFVPQLHPSGSGAGAG
ncbi:MAG TPA: hypothetical protein VHE57_03290 [Mycobacteriales bacterium]|nr:hypothetical protein [Mycobacteriales bacterium]